jgi:hypothetical protein
MTDLASGAFDRFSWASGHPARLNFGDCMAYAVATVMRAPLLVQRRRFWADGCHGASRLDTPLMNPALSAGQANYLGLPRSGPLKPNITGFEEPAGQRRQPRSRGI